jgi:hypothetical protein
MPNPVRTVHLECASPIRNHTKEILQMRTQDSQPTGRRQSRRGPRRHHQSRGGERYNAAPKAPAKKTFWQKIVSFFAGDGRTKSAVATANESPRSDRGEERKFSRKPERVEVSSPKVYVGNLSFDATESDLFDLFNGVGKVQNAEIVSHKYTQKSKGFAFVVMASIDEAKRAVEVLHDKEFMGRKLVVSGAKTNDARGTA